MPAQLVHDLKALEVAEDMGQATMPEDLRKATARAQARVSAWLAQVHQCQKREDDRCLVPLHISPAARPAYIPSPDTGS
jgi:hypothetical protein